MLKLSRREALTGALLAAVVPSEAVAEAHPHVEWLEEWRALRDRYETLPDDGFDDPDGIWDQMNTLTDQIYANEPATPQGMIAQLRFFQEDLHFFADCGANETAANNVIDTAAAFLARI